MSRGVPEGRRTALQAFRPMLISVSKGRHLRRDGGAALTVTLGSVAGAVPGGSLRNENNLAVGAGLKYLLVSAGGLGERELLSDHGPESVVL